MIIEYHRPKTVEEALYLLKRGEMKTVPLGGGTVVNQPSDQQIAVVDLQSLGLDRIERRGKELVIGATATLQALLEHPDLPAGLRQVIELEATYNLRQVATLAGTLVSAGGRSPLATALLALDAQLVLLPGDEQMSLGDFLPTRQQRLPGRLVTVVTLPLGAAFAYHTVARTPADQPIVCAAAARWPSGRTRLALGGYGPAPVMAFDGPEAEGVETAARSAYAQAGDEWASAEYRAEIAAVLARRCIEELA
jgi:probable selenate reductase FAD-binding subunit